MEVRLIEQKLTKREKKVVQMREKIYYAAIELFTENGYDAVKVADICKEANVSLGTFYNYYSSKKNLLEEYAAAIDNHLEMIVDFVTAAPVKDRIRQLMITKISFSTKWVEFAEEANIPMGIVVCKEVYSKDSKFSRMLFEAIEQGITEGVFKACLDIEVTVEMALYIIYGLGSHYRFSSHGFDINYRTDKIISNFIKMLSVDKE